MGRIELMEGDITKIHVDAIVNAANSSLLGGGGVDGAIHRAAGPELLEECRKLRGCPTGEAKITGGYRLPAGHVIHTVGPVWHGGGHGEDEELTGCYENSLKLAEENRMMSIAFPSISTGAYRFPIHRASGIAVNTVREYLRHSRVVERVVFVCYSHADYHVYLNKLGAVVQEIS
jgi:O-acetyl-ADP-ribose deacetylase (regulator of RNase III)